MKRRHKRIIFIVCCLAALGLAIALVLGALGDNLAFSISPTDIVTKRPPGNRVLRVGGLVEKGTLKRDNDGLTLRFAVTDTAYTVPVVYKETASHPVPVVLCRDVLVLTAFSMPTRLWPNMTRTTCLPKQEKLLTKQKQRKHWWISKEFGEKFDKRNAGEL